MDVIAVGDIALVRHALDDAEALLQALRKLIGRALERRAVQRIVDDLGGLPLRGILVELLHNFEAKLLALRLGELLADEAVDALPQTGVAERQRRIAAVQELIDGLALLEASKRAVLPQDRRGIRHGAGQALVAALQRAVAQLHTLIEDLPKLIHIALRAQTDVHKVDGDNALVEASVVFRLAFLINIGGQEAAAAHAGVTVTLAVLVDLVLQHNLLADIVGHHTASGTLRRELGQLIVGAAFVDVVLLEHVDKLRECGGDPHALFVLNALIALLEGLLDDEGEILLLLLVLRLVKVHKNGNKGSLTVGGHQGDDLILDGLHALADLLAQTALDELFKALGLDGLTDLLKARDQLRADLLTANLHKRREVGQADALTAVLVGGDLRDDLGRDVARRRERMRTLDLGAADDGAVLQHILEVDQIAVVHMLREIVRVVEMDQARIVRLDDLLRQQNTLGDILADLTRHIVALHAVDGGVLVGVLLLDLLVVALD